MNNNRNNNRRRGRSNRGQGGGGSQGNRIDSRARGNAPQMLEKYKKLAHDASLNGDRVQTEYYLQFADHYFRVLADQKSPKDDQRGRRDDRDPDDEGDYASDAEDTASHRDRGRRDEGDAVKFGSEGEEAFEADENPFVRESSKPPRGRGRKVPANGAEDEGGSGGGLDPASLPPPIGAGRGSDDETGEGQARPRRRSRRPRGSGDDETLEAVG